MYLIIIGVILFAILIAWGSSLSEKKSARLTELGIKESDLFESGNYLMGHPQQDEPIQNLRLNITDSHLEFYSNPIEPVKRFEIPKAAISNIVIEDKTTVERRVTIGRMLLTGIFAFAWKKKEVKNSAFIVIEWTQGKFPHETLLEFSGPSAIPLANKIRNKMINSIS